MSIAQMKRRIDAIHSRSAPVGRLSITLEEAHRMLWKQDKPAYLELAREGVHSVIFFQEQFEREDAAAAEQALLRNRGKIR